MDVPTFVTAGAYGDRLMRLSIAIRDPTPIFLHPRGYPPATRLSTRPIHRPRGGHATSVAMGRGRSGLGRYAAITSISSPTAAMVATSPLRCQLMCGFDEISEMRSQPVDVTLSEDLVPAMKVSERLLKFTGPNARLDPAAPSRTAAKLPPKNRGKGQLPKR